jgi:hypothetical protein
MKFSPPIRPLIGFIRDAEVAEENIPFRESGDADSLKDFSLRTRRLCGEKVRIFPKPPLHSGSSFSL